jgi:endonuclease/exonuclease/phosphatase (EEP) superfamily protein YafD
VLQFVYPLTAVLVDWAVYGRTLAAVQLCGVVLMAGDMNTTPWARGMWALDDFLRSATGAVPSWPNAGGVLSLLPLDHVLASTGWQTLGAQHGPHLGSDHRPVVVRLVVRQP